MPVSDFFRVVPTGITLYLRVTPNAGRDSIDGPERRDDGSCALRIRVAAVPDKGKANTAVIALLAKKLKIPKSDISLIQGETSRFKTVSIAVTAPDTAKLLLCLQ